MSTLITLMQSGTDIIPKGEKLLQVTGLKAGKSGKGKKAGKTPDKGAKANEKDVKASPLKTASGKS